MGDQRRRAVAQQQSAAHSQRYRTMDSSRVQKTEHSYGLLDVDDGAAAAHGRASQSEAQSGLWTKSKM